MKKESEGKRKEGVFRKRHTHTDYGQQLFVNFPPNINRTHLLFTFRHQVNPSTILFWSQRYLPFSYMQTSGPSSNPSSMFLANNNFFKYTFTDHKECPTFQKLKSSLTTNNISKHRIVSHKITRFAILFHLFLPCYIYSK